MTRRTSLAIALVAATAVSGSIAAQQGNEEFARRQYESGLSFLETQRDAEGLKDLQAVVDAFPQSSVADNALLRIAQHQLEAARDLDTAQAAVDRLLKEYPDTDSAPMAHVLGGRIAFAKGHTPAAVDAALASFERVPRLFPGNDAVAAAGFYAGETLRAVRRDADALERLRRVTLEYPRSAWAARASLAAGACLLQQNRPPQALQAFQRARQLFPNTQTAAQALNLNSIAYRLYVRAPAQPAFSFSGRAIGPERSEFRDVNGIKFDAAGQVLLGHRNGVALFKPDGTAGTPVGAQDATAFFLDERDRVVLAIDGSLVAARAEKIAFSGPGGDGQLRAVDEIPAALINSRGERLIANPKAKNVLRSLPTGKFVSVFATGTIERMAQNWLGDIAMLDRATKSVAVADAEGKVIMRVPTRGTGYEFDAPTDVAFDALGHLYVLDRGRSAVFVFNPKGQLITSVTIPDRSPGALNRAEALAVDEAGRLFVFDERARRIQVYQ